MGYQFYNSLEQKVFALKHAVFLEKKFLLKNSGSKVELEEVQDAQADANQLPELEADIHRNEIATNPSRAQVLRRSSRIHIVPERYGFLISKQNDVLLMEDNEPTMYEEHLNISLSDKWLIAMKSEMDSMYENQVWALLDPPEGIKPIGCKWVFKKNTDMEGKVVTYKARLVAKGYRKKQGVAYDETFSPVAMLISIRILLTIAAHYDYEIWKMDGKTAFLNRNLSKAMYMTQPEGFTSKDGSKLWELQKSIYGLRW